MAGGPSGGVIDINGEDGFALEGILQFQFEFHQFLGLHEWPIFELCFTFYDLEELQSIEFPRLNEVQGGLNIIGNRELVEINMPMLVHLHPNC